MMDENEPSMVDWFIGVRKVPHSVIPRVNKRH